MWKCPICGTENDEQKNGYICTECEFDQSLNYEDLPSLQEIDSTLCRTLNDFRSDYKLVSVKYMCQKCNHKLFFFLPDSGQFVCSKCGSEYSLSSFNFNARAKQCYQEGECPVDLMNDNMQEKFQRYPHKPKFYTCVSIGSNHYLALRKNGQVDAFGDNDNKQCEVKDWSDVTYVCANSKHSFGIKKDGSVVMTGEDPLFRPILNWKAVVSLSVRDNYALGSGSEGNLLIVGDLPFALGLTAKLGPAIMHSAGLKHAVALLKNKTVIAVGDNSKGQCNAFEGVNQPWHDVIAISAGDYHTLALKSDGTVYACGDNSEGQCDVADLEHIVAISAGAHHSVFVKDDGALIFRGSNLFKQNDIRISHDIIAVSSYGDNALALLPNDRLLKAPITK